MLGLPAWAAEGPLVVDGMPSHYAVSDARGEVSPWDFANTTGDTEVIELYRRSNSLRKTISITGYVGGGSLAYVGLLGMVFGAVDSSPALAGIGFTAGAAGLTTIGLAAVNQVSWGRRLDDYETWWTLDEAVALAEAYNAGLDVTVASARDIHIQDAPGGFEAVDAGGRLDAGEFASRVGDTTTYRQWNTLRVACNATGWTAFGVGLVMASNSLPAALTDLGNGQVPDPVVGSLALLGVGALFGGPLFVYGTKLFYNDLDRYYSREEAEAWAADARAELRPRVQVEVYPSALVMRW